MEATWSERPTCWMSTHKQLTDEWKRLRLGRGTMSLAAAMAGHLPPKIFEDFYGNRTKLAEIIVGTSEKSFDSESKARMEHGSSFEPVVRTWYQDEIVKVPIEEVGLAIWKTDPRFGGSLDGEFTLNDSSHGLEIKSPQKLYRQLIEYAEAFKKGFRTPPEAHIFRSHYDQMIGNGVITGKTWMHYVVMSPSREVYWENFPVDYDYWNDDLYPNMKHFYIRYVEPLLAQLKLERIDPP